jgi:hypothetical protein
MYVNMIPEYMRWVTDEDLEKIQLLGLAQKVGHDYLYTSNDCRMDDFIGAKRYVLRKQNPTHFMYSNLCSK